MLVVLDTNIVVSALITPEGGPGRVLEAWRAEQYNLCTSEMLIQEMEEVLLRRKFLKRPLQVVENAQSVVLRIRSYALIVSLEVIPRGVPNDPDDDVVLATAVAGRVDGIVSGDQHLLALGRHQGIAIMTPLQFLAELPRRSH